MPTHILSYHMVPPLNNYHILKLALIPVLDYSCILKLVLVLVPVLKKLHSQIGTGTYF